MWPASVSPRRAPNLQESHTDISWEFAPQKSEAEFEMLLQEFCQLARLGFTILLTNRNLNLLGLQMR